jgi:hypothetical protein
MGETEGEKFKWTCVYVNVIIIIQYLIDVSEHNQGLQAK